MHPPKTSRCRRFVVLHDLHLDRLVFDALSTWASDNGLHFQDAIQLAICAFNDRSSAMDDASSATRAIDGIARRSPHIPSTEPAQP